MRPPQCFCWNGFFRVENLQNPKSASYCEGAIQGLNVSLCAGIIGGDPPDAGSFLVPSGWAQAPSAVRRLCQECFPSLSLQQPPTTLWTVILVFKTWPCFLTVALSLPLALLTCPISSEQPWESSLQPFDALYLIVLLSLQHTEILLTSIFTL